MPIFPSFSSSSSLERKKEKRFADIRKQTEDSFSLVGRRRSEWIYTSCVFTNLYKVFTSLLLVAFVACVLHFANFPRVLWGERTKTATATEIQLFTREVVNARLFSGFSLYFFSFFSQSGDDCEWRRFHESGKNLRENLMKWTLVRRCRDRN